MSGNTVRSADVYRKVKSRILNGRLRPLERLSPSAIAGELGVSLGVAREALTRLAGENLVETQTNKGFRVADVSLEKLKALADVRILLETEALRQSIESGDLDWESQIIAAHHQLTRSPGQGEEVDELGSDVHMIAHRKFHMALISECPNQMLLEICSSMWDEGELYRRWGAGRDAQVWMKEHSDLVQCCVDRKVEQASELLKEHILGTVHAVELALANGGTYPKDVER